MKHKTLLTIELVALVCGLYAAVAFSVFQWRNPLANKMSFYRDFGAVMRFEKLPCYQLPNNQIT